MTEKATGRKQLNWQKTGPMTLLPKIEKNAIQPNYSQDEINQAVDALKEQYPKELDKILKQGETT